MRKKKIDSFICFLFLLISLVLFFFLRLTYEMQKEKQQYTALFSLGNLSYDQDFLKNATKIKGLQEIWPVVEVPVTIKIEDYTKTTVFNGIDPDAFTENSRQDNLGNTPLLLLGSNSLENMKDSNGHAISKKQQNTYLKMGEELAITYTLDSIRSSKSSAENSSSIYSGSSMAMNNPGDNISSVSWLPCKVAAVLPGENDQIYIPLSQARALCSETGTPLTVTKVLLKIKGKDSLESARQLFE
ncbi:hypothetical protein ACTQ50_01600 [Blautia sp. Sow4_E7]|uniref:hypothetical protein n=1 Tax=Blautia sp. Sow4_E7 TaxID=3438749 RepID=UPI003F928F9B